MPHRLDTRDPSFGETFAAFLAAKREAVADVDATVSAILADVRARGDLALAAYTESYDSFQLTPDTIRLSASEVDAAVAQVASRERAALETAAERVEAYHRGQIPPDSRYTDAVGVELGHRWSPIASAGLYVPGGKAAYPSSVLMNAIPARTAGVNRLAMAVPTPGGNLNPLVMAAARTAGVTEIYRIGGAQAVAALAFGTESVPQVDKIVGPGNAYVASAKRQVFGAVGVDMVAGPSEILVYADGDNDAAWIAADLLSQAEHDETAQAILVTADEAFADKVVAAVATCLATLSRAAIAGASWRDYGAVILVRDALEAIELIDRIAPEHLELATANANAMAAGVRNAGAMFLGGHCPEAVGDYVAGPSHVLPTGGSARFASGLSVLDFMKRTSLIRCDSKSLRAIGGAAATLAEAEGLEAHALSIRLRLGDTGMSGEV